MSLRRAAQAALCGLALALPAAPAAEVNKYLPDDTRVVLSVNVRQLLDSEIVKKAVLPKIEDDLRNNADYQQFKTALGLDPFQDVSSVTVALPGEIGVTKGLAVVQGSFDLAKIHGVADQVIQQHPQHLSFTEQDRVRVYEIKDENKPVTVYLAFVSKDVAVAALSKTYVTDAIARGAGKPSARSNKTLATLLGKQDGRQSLWYASQVTPEMKKQLASNPNTKPYADRLQSLSGGLTVAGDVRFHLDFHSSDAQTARLMKSQLDGVKGLVLLAAASNEQLKEYAPLLTELGNAIEVVQNQGKVSVEVKLGGKLLKDLQSLAEKSLKK